MQFSIFSSALCAVSTWKLWPAVLCYCHLCIWIWLLAVLWRKKKQQLGFWPFSRTFFLSWLLEKMAELIINGRAEQYMSVIFRSKIYGIHLLLSFYILVYNFLQFLSFRKSLKNFAIPDNGLTHLVMPRCQVEMLRTFA